MKRVPENQEELNEKQMAEIEQLKKDYLETFNSNAGKRVLADLERKCFINQTTFSNTEGRTLFNEGMRFVVVNIKNMINMNIAMLKKLAKES